MEQQRNVPEVRETTPETARASRPPAQFATSASATRAAQLYSRETAEGPLSPTEPPPGYTAFDVATSDGLRDGVKTLGPRTRDLLTAEETGRHYVAALAEGETATVDAQIDRRLDDVTRAALGRKELDPQAVGKDAKTTIEGAYITPAGPDRPGLAADLVRSATRGLHASRMDSDTRGTPGAAGFTGVATYRSASAAEISDAPETPVSRAAAYVAVPGATDGGATPNPGPLAARPLTDAGSGSTPTRSDSSSTTPATDASGSSTAA